MRYLLALALVACGDQHEVLDVFEPHSGTRLLIEQYQFDDGTRIVHPDAFFDRRLHARCTPQTWTDGTTRCLPDADVAYYREATCETLIGVTRVEKPTHFIATDLVDGTLFPSRVFAAGALTDAIDSAFTKEGESCLPVGIFADSKTTFREVGGEVDVAALPQIHEGETADGRLALSLRQSDDGAVVPIGFRDRELDTACTPAARPTGDGVCEPIEIPLAAYFADSECSQPAIIVDDKPPTIARVPTTGCAAFARVGDEVSHAYALVNGACRTETSPGRTFVVGDTVELAPITRTPDAVPQRRVQRILASDDALHVYADRMLDTATQAECRLQLVGETMRCLPLELAPVVRVFQAGCTIELRVAQVPAQSCEPVGFGALNTGDALEVHAIGDAFTGTAYTLDLGPCLPYTPPAGTTLHLVGPVLPDDAFIGALAFGVR